MEYELIRSRRRTLAVEVTRDGKVLARAPLRMPQSQIEAFLARQSAWIAKAVARQLTRAQNHPAPTPGEEQALRRRAHEILPGRVAHYAAIMGVQPTRITITSAQKRFGSCSAQNALSFSWRLMQYPDDAVDYVVVHELAHIVHHNHSRDFYALIAHYLPDWKTRAGKLKE